MSFYLQDAEKKKKKKKFINHNNAIYTS